MSQIQLKEMFESGVHLGTHVKQLNPKMRPYIMCVRQGIAIIDIFKTYTKLFRITLFIKKIIASEGYNVLFVGTQKSIAPLIAEIAEKSSSFYINDKWKGGLLTNFRTIKKNFENKSKLLKSSSKTKFSEILLNQNSTPIINFGIKNMRQLPDFVIVIGQDKEIKAIKECRKLGIPIISILDTDGDPSLTDLFIPANDDNRNAVECILKPLGQAIGIGRLLYEKNPRILVKKTFNI